MTRLTIAACIAALVATMGMALAQERAPIILGAETVAYIRTGGTCGTIDQRQARIDQRIVQVLSDERPEIFVEALGGPRLKVYQSDGRWTLGIGKTMIIQAYPEDAAGTTPRALVEQWKVNFERQLPRAVSPMHVPTWWTDPHAEEAGPVTGQREHGMPAEDLPLVREIAEILNAAREVEDDKLEDMFPTMEQALLENVWTYRHPSCGPAPLTQHIRASSVLKRAKGLDEAQYRYERYWLAGVTANKLRDAMKMPAGIGPVPEQRDLPDFEALAKIQDAPVAPEPVTTPPTPPATTPEPAPITPQPSVGDESIIERVAIGTGLGSDNALLNVGDQFAAGTSQLMVYLQTHGAPNNTIIAVTLANEDGMLAQRRVRVSGNHRMAVTFFPSTDATAFASGKYNIRLTANGEDAGLLPFGIGTE